MTNSKYVGAHRKPSDRRGARILTGIAASGLIAGPLAVLLGGGIADAKPAHGSGVNMKIPGTTGTDIYGNPTAPSPSADNSKPTYDQPQKQPSPYGLPAYTETPGVDQTQQGRKWTVGTTPQEPWTVGTKPRGPWTLGANPSGPTSAVR